MTTSKVISVRGADTLLATKPKNVNTYEAKLLYSMIRGGDRINQIVLSVPNFSHYEVQRFSSYMNHIYNKDSALTSATWCV